MQQEPPSSLELFGLRRRIQRVADALRRILRQWPVVGVPVQAVQNYIHHQSANQAGSVAFSAVLSLFPLLLFTAAAAAYVGQPGTAAALLKRLLEYAPPLVAQSLYPVVESLLAQPSRTMLTVGVIVTVWTASSGVQAVRTALNRAYGVEQALSFWKARLKVTLFTLAGTAVALLAFGTVVVWPYLWQAIDFSGAGGRGLSWIGVAVRYALAWITLVLLYAAMYGWLPDRRQQIRSVLPGALVGAALWIIAAAFLSYTLHSAGKLALVYGGFAGLVATLVFLYVSAVTLIYGAEINAVMAQRRSRDQPSKRGFICQVENVSAAANDTQAR